MIHQQSNHSSSKKAYFIHLEGYSKRAIQKAVNQIFPLQPSSAFHPTLSTCPSSMGPFVNFTNAKNTLEHKYTGFGWDRIKILHFFKPVQISPNQRLRRHVSYKTSLKTNASSDPKHLLIWSYMFTPT